jgi:hypothetical protein
LSSHRQLTCGIGAEWWDATASSATSSSISVAAVPVEVTGEGPTISLGLMRLKGAGILVTELGRRECPWESEEAEDLEPRKVSQLKLLFSWLQFTSVRVQGKESKLGRKSNGRTYIGIKGECRAPESEVDISVRWENALPVEDLSGASRAMTIPCTTFSDADSGRV